MTAQPEALRLADRLKDGWGMSLRDECAAELRRLHAENEALRTALAEPVQIEWVETEGNTKGMRLRDILNPRHPSAIGTVMWHTNKPVTDNPVFEVREALRERLGEQA